MKKKLINALFATAILVFLLNGCQKPQQLKTLTPNLPENPYSYQGCITSGFGCTDNTPADNMLSFEAATLGRVLFYDPRLSLNNTVSCATCHKQANAFADDAVFSTGFENVTTRRNTPALINEFGKNSFFWDGRATSLEQMVLMPVGDHVEMGMDRLDIMEKKIASIDFYPQLFQEAFGSRAITHDRISKALAQFVRAIRSTNTRFDNNSLTQQEEEGRIAFSKFKCDGCHRGPDLGGAPMFTSYNGTSSTPNAANIGLDVNYLDNGIAEITGDERSAGAFIIPSLRNLVYTAPYMHDGRYKTLEEVIEHYNSGIKESAALDEILKDPVTKAPLKMNMTAEQKLALAAFLRAFSDPAVTTDVRFSNPFN